MKIARVIEVDGKLQICIRDKVLSTLIVSVPSLCDCAGGDQLV